MNGTPGGYKGTPLFKNWISAAGGVLAASAVFAFVFLFVMDLFAATSNPYVGILMWVIAPGFFILGMALVAVGWWQQRRYVRRGGPVTGRPFVIDLSRPRDRRILGSFLVGSLVFLILTAIGSNRTYHYTESVQFCGQACHEPMKPEFTSYQNSPHARVGCTECHVGEGAKGYITAKLNGVHQLLGVITGDFDRPIKTPIKNLPPAQETCTQCHWPDRQVGNLDRTYTHFLADETNTLFTVRLSLKVGGGDPRRGEVGGIHWHMHLANKVEYIATDERLQVIPWVRFTDATGKVTEYRTPDFKDDPAKHSIRTMDCMDCHNRPAHQYLSPNTAVDRAMAAGRIDPAMPWVKSNVVAALIQPYNTEREALEGIAQTLRAKYTGHPKIEGVITETQTIFRQNFFPEMKADWRAYPDNISHKDWPGCFRCHDGQHKASDGKTSIKASDCNACHTILAQGNGPDLEKLSATGHSFFHIDAVNEDPTCTQCHTGAFPKE